MFLWIVEPLGFAYGIIAANHADAIKKWFVERWTVKVVILMLISGGLDLAYLKYKPTPFIGDYLLKIVLGIAISAFLFCLIAKLKVRNRANSFLGNISYEVYLLHHGVFALLMAIDRNMMNSGLFIVLSIFITLGLALILKKVSDMLISRIRI